MEPVYDVEKNKILVSDCCGVEAYSNGDSDTSDICICPQCGEHCEYIYVDED